MAPTTLPSFFNGMPPAKIMTLPSLEAWMPKNWLPDWEWVARSLVAMSKAREVQAFLMEMSMEPSQALSMRTWAMRLPPASATAMFMGWPISAAFFSAAAMMRRASASWIIGAPYLRKNYGEGFVVFFRGVFKKWSFSCGVLMVKTW